MENTTFSALSDTVMLLRSATDQALVIWVPPLPAEADIVPGTGWRDSLATWARGCLNLLIEQEKYNT